jgi:putative acetyltransferase
MQIRREERRDIPLIADVHARAFGDTDHVPALVSALRSAPASTPTQSFVACIDDVLVGHTMLSASRLDAPRRIVDVATLSPLGVLPRYQGRGVGAELVAQALEEADSLRIPLVFLEGDPGYYASRGFVRADLYGFRKPSLRVPDDAFQVAILSAYEPWMTGTLVYSETFWALDCVGLRDPTDS